MANTYTSVSKALGVEGQIYSKYTMPLVSIMTLWPHLNRHTHSRTRYSHFVFIKSAALKERPATTS